MCCSAAAFSVVIDLLSWYGRISWSGRETNATAMPVVVVVVVVFYGVVAGSSVFLRWAFGRYTLYQSARRRLGRRRSEFQFELIHYSFERRRRKRENKNNDADAPISKHVVVLIPNSASLRGETTVMATASIATKKPPYCNRMPLREKDVIFFFLFFLRQNFVSRRLFCALNNNLFYEDDDRYCSIKVMVYPSTTICLFEITPPSLCV